MTVCLLVVLDIVILTLLLCLYVCVPNRWRPTIL